MLDAIILLLGLAIVLGPRVLFSRSKNDLREVSSLNSLPEVRMTNTDRQELVSMARAALRSQRDGVPALIAWAEIARATVVLPEPLLPNAIVMNCDVEVRDSQRKPSHLRIVLPGEKTVVNTEYRC